MRGASADSLATLTETLGQAVESGARTPGGTARLADDLFGVAGILAHEPSLRRVLTDLSLLSGAKSDLARTVFAGKIDAPALDLLVQAAGLRWAATRDLPDALEHLGVVALVKGADPSGRGDQLEDELFAVDRLISDNPDLRDALADSSRSLADRSALLHGLLDGKAAPETVRLAEQALAGSYRTVAVALEKFAKTAADNRNRLVGVVRVAQELSTADKSRLEAALSKQYNRAVHLNVLVDPKVIGGVKVEIGDDVIDGTIASRLDDARRRLAG